MPYRACMGGSDASARGQEKRVVLAPAVSHTKRQVDPSSAAAITEEDDDTDDDDPDTMAKE
eukprot:2979538-Rhodomonas_salina.2